MKYHGTVVTVFFVYKLDIWSRDLNTDFTLKDCLFAVVKLTKNAVPDIHILDMVLDLIHVHIFRFQILILVKMLLFLV